MNIKNVKLVSGEDIVCDYEQIEGTRYAILRNPVQITIVPNRTGGQPNFGFAPFPMTGEVKELQIGKQHIIFVADIHDEFKNQYNSIFGTGIVTPPKNLII
jgi:hypothetical protein